MKSEAEAEKSLQSILKDEPIVFNGTLSELLPEANFTSRSEQIKRNISDFFQTCFSNNRLVQEMIQLGVKNDRFASQYQKSLALFSVEMLSGQFGDSYKLFIRDEDDRKSLVNSKILKNQSEIQEQIQVGHSQNQDSFFQKYQNLIKLLQYIRRPLPQLSQICMNYFVKIFNNIVNNKAQDVYIYFDSQYNKKSSIIAQSQQNVISSILHEKTQLQYLIDHAYNFGGVSQMLGKMIAQQGPVNKYVSIKTKINQQMLAMLKSEKLIKSCPNYYQYLLDFVSYVLSRTKYKSEDQTQQIAQVSQRFVDQDVIWFFKEKIAKAALDSNGILVHNFLSTSGNLNRSQSSKSTNRKQTQLRPENYEQFQSFQNIFQNSVAYMRIIIQRINSQEQLEQDLTQSMKMPQPTMNFQVDQALYGQNSLYELLTLQIPSIYKSINKMHYYEFLLKMTRNSRFKKQNHEKQIGLLPSFVVPILNHLLITFKKEQNRNGLVNFYIQQLICESILPRIQKLQIKQAMRVMSALDPKLQLLKDCDDTMAFLRKMFIILRRKSEVVEDHAIKIGFDLNSLQAKFLKKLGGNTSVLQNRKNVVKQLAFLYEKGSKPQQQKNMNISKSQRCQDDDQSEEQDKFLATFNPSREFSYPQQKNQSPKKQQAVQNINADLQQNILKNQEQIKQQIYVNSEMTSQNKSKDILQIPKQNKIQLLIDSAGEEQIQQNQVIREDMVPQQPQETLIQ